MNNFEAIKETIKNGSSIHMMMMNTTNENILNSSIEELAEIINEKMDKTPCNYYCNNCGGKDVVYSHCEQQIIKWLSE